MGDTDFGGNFGRNFEGSSGIEAGQVKGGFDTDIFPWICTAYKIPKNSHPHMLLRIQNCEGVGKTKKCGNFGWYSLTMSDGAHTTQLDYQLAANFPTTRDGKWHHSCLNLDDVLDTKWEGKSHIVDAMIWHRPGVLAAGTFWIVSILPSPHRPQYTSNLKSSV